MNTLILYATKHGATEKCVKTLSTELTGDVVSCNIKKEAVPDLKEFDSIIVGGSIYAGMIQKGIKAFCDNNATILSTKKTGFFVCGMSTGEAARKQLDLVFSQPLLSHATAKEFFGGEVILKKMNFFEKLIMKKIGKIDKDFNNILPDNIKKFAIEMNA